MLPSRWKLKTSAANPRLYTDTLHYNINPVAMYTLPDLPYPYDALEPHIDARTMELHHTKHHQAYLTKLNSALAHMSEPPAHIRELLLHIDQYDDSIRNNAGGHYNHSFFWKTLSPDPTNEPEGHLKHLINTTYGSLAHFTHRFTEKALQLFGAGWTWLCIDPEQHLHLVNTPNQDNPLMNYTQANLTPLLGLDLWEHAYYLHYQNRRSDYINAFWHLLDWAVVAKRYTDFCDYHGRTQQER